MRGFEANDCRLCKTTFCCPKCRLKHEINKHKIFPECNLCIYGQSERDDMLKEGQLAHLEQTHLPLNCVHCRRIFSSVAEIRQHRKCPVLQQRNDSPKTPLIEPNTGEVDEEAQDSPILLEWQRKESLNRIFNLATSTPMLTTEASVIFEKNRVSDIQFDIEKSSQIINKSIIRRTDSRVDSMKDDNSSKRRVTFEKSSLKSGHFKNMDSDLEGRADKTPNTPGKSRENIPNSPVTPATSMQSDQFYSAKSELREFLSARQRPPSSEEFTPVGVSLSKVIPAKESVYWSSDLATPTSKEQTINLSLSDLNGVSMDMDSAHGNPRTTPMYRTSKTNKLHDSPATDVPKIRTKISEVMGEDKFTNQHMLRVQESEVCSTDPHVDEVKIKTEIGDIDEDELLEQNVPDGVPDPALYFAETAGNIITEVSILKSPHKANEPQGGSSQTDQQTSSGKIIPNSPVTPATGIKIEQFYSAKSEFNEVSSTTGFLRRRLPLSDRFAPVGRSQISNVNAQETINALSDLHAPSVLVQKTFGVASSKDENLNITQPHDISMEICSPLSASNFTKSSLISLSPTKISDQSKKADSNLSTPGNSGEISVKEAMYTFNGTSKNGYSAIDRETFPVNDVRNVIEEEESMEEHAPDVIQGPKILPLVVGRSHISDVSAQENINALSHLSAPNVSVQKSFGAATPKENLNTTDPNEVSMEICSPLSASNFTKSSSIPSSPSSDRSKTSDANLSTPGNSGDIIIKGAMYTFNETSKHGYSAIDQENFPVNYVRSDIKEEEFIEEHAPDDIQGPKILPAVGEKNNEQCEPLKADQYNAPVAENGQKLNGEICVAKHNSNDKQSEEAHSSNYRKTLRLSTGNTVDEENDENKPPNFEVTNQKNNGTPSGPVKSIKLRTKDRTYLHNNGESKTSRTTDSPAELLQSRVTISMPTPVLKKTDVRISFNFPSHLASTPIIQKSSKLKQMNIIDEISKIPQYLLSSEPNNLPLPKSYSSEETKQCKDLADYDSKPENEESAHGFVTVSSMTESSLWTSMTRIVKSVFGGLHSRSEDNAIDTSIRSSNSLSFKRRHSSDTESDTNNYSSTPRVKRFKFSDIKCRRPIREPLELPSRVPQPPDGVATFEIVRTVYEAGPRCKMMWDKATQTDDYLMDGWHPQQK